MALGYISMISLASLLEININNPSLFFNEVVIQIFPLIILFILTILTDLNKSSDSTQPGTTLKVV
jgi:positive regulator of sigma E activity